MQKVRALLTILGAGLALGGCSSEPLSGSSEGGASGGGAQGGAGASHQPSACSAALKQSLSLVDEVSTGKVAILGESDGARTLYVDASVGGLNGQDSHPWVYLSLQTGMAVPLTDLEALDSTAWDLALKRSVIRTNGGDSGPGQGGAIRVALPWSDVNEATLGSKRLPKESFFDQDCQLMLDASQNLITTFSGWSEYDEASHVLSAAPDVVFITAGADGATYKVAVLDYYATPTGGHGTVSGRYLLRTAPLP